MQSTFFLKTNRIGFRCWSKGDFQLASALWGSPEVTQFIVVKPLTDQEIQEKLDEEVLSMSQSGVQYWPIFSLESGRHLGCCGLRKYKESLSTLEIGFHLNREFWGYGYAKEAASAIIDYALNSLSVGRLAAGHHPQNISSKKLLASLNFEFSHFELYEPTGLQHPMYFLEEKKYQN